MEILGVVATVVLGYEMRMADGGRLRVPGAKRQGMGVVVLHPEDGLDVLMKRRREFEGVEWRYDVGEQMGSDDVVF